MSEEEKLLVSCQICMDVCKRAVSVKCCDARACRACATKKVTSSRFCWNNACKIPMNTEALQNDEDVRCAVEHFKAGRSIPTHIFLKLKGNGNVHKRSSLSQDIWNNSAKRVKTEIQSEVKKENIKSEPIIEINEPRTDIKVESVTDIKVEPTRDIKDEPESKSKPELNDDVLHSDNNDDGNDSDSEVDQNDEEMFKPYQSLSTKTLGEMKELIKIFVSTLTVNKAGTSTPLFEIGAFNPSSGNKFQYSFPRETALMKLKREKQAKGTWKESKRSGFSPISVNHMNPGMKEFCNFLKHESQLKEKIILVFYTKVEMCAFLKQLKDLKFDLKKMPLLHPEKAIGLLQKIGVDYVSHLKLSAPIQPLSEAVHSNIRDEDMETASINLAHFCSEHQKLQCYGIDPFVWKLHGNGKYCQVYGRIKFVDKKKGYGQMLSCLHIPDDNIIPCFRKDKKASLMEKQMNPSFNMASSAPAGQMSKRAQKRLANKQKKWGKPQQQNQQQLHGYSQQYP